MSYADSMGNVMLLSCYVMFFVSAGIDSSSPATLKRISGLENEWMNEYILWYVLYYVCLYVWTSLLLLFFWQGHWWKTNF